MTYILRKRRTKPMLKGKRLCTSGAIMSDETLSTLTKNIRERREIWTLKISFQN